MSKFEVSDTLPQWIRDHIDLYQRDPEAGKSWDSSPAGGSGILPSLLLISTGAKSGVRRALPLIYKQIGADYVIVASKGGAPEHPSWYINLMANPDCEIWVGTDKMVARARAATGAERSAKWAEMAEIYPPYNDYQARSQGREIPVVVLEVVGPA